MRKCEDIWKQSVGGTVRRCYQLKHRRTIGGVPPRHRISHSVEKVQRFMEKVLLGTKLVERLLERVLLINF
jgi:hypothetical protein